MVLLLIGVSQSASNVDVRGNDNVANEPAANSNDQRLTEYTHDGRMIEIITMEDIDAMMRLENFKNLASAEGGLRKLEDEEDDTCWHGGQDNQVLSWLVRLDSTDEDPFDTKLAHSIFVLLSTGKNLGQLSNNEPLLLWYASSSHGVLVSKSLPSQLRRKMCVHSKCFQLPFERH